MKWIKCANKLPNNHEECLAAFLILPESPKCGLCYIKAMFIHGIFYSMESEKHEIIHCVIYWMRVPKLPKVPKLPERKTE